MVGPAGNRSGLADSPRPIPATVNPTQRQFKRNVHRPDLVDEVDVVLDPPLSNSELWLHVDAIDHDLRLRSDLHPPQETE